MQYVIIKHEYRYALISGPFRRISDYELLSPEGILVYSKDLHPDRATAKAFLVGKLQEDLAYHQAKALDLMTQIANLGAP